MLASLTPGRQNHMLALGLEASRYAVYTSSHGYLTRAYS